MPCGRGVNLSHVSLTSVVTLATLRLLPKTNPKLYEEISADTTHFHSGEEPAFFTPENDLDIPIDVIQSTVMAGGSVVNEGFAIDDGGVVIQTGVAEELEAIEGEKIDNNVLVELGCVR